MKLFILLFVITFSAVAQKSPCVVQDIMPVNESGKYFYHETVINDTLSEEKLFNNAVLFLKSQKVIHKKDTLLTTNVEEGTILTKRSFPVRFTDIGGSHIDGEIFYKLVIEVKKGCYRYTYSDFLFDEYKKNQFGEYKSANLRKRTLEKEIADSEKDVWCKRKTALHTYLENEIAKLKIAIATPPTPELPKEKKKKVVKVETNR
jgi:hypothetical protein